MRQLQSIIDHVDADAHATSIGRLTEDLQSTLNGAVSSPVARVSHRAGIRLHVPSGPVDGATPLPSDVRGTLRQLGRFRGVLEAEYGVRVGDL
jgi:hypothetical protein